MCIINFQKQIFCLTVFVLLFIIFHNSNGNSFKRSVEKTHKADKIVSEEDPRKDPGAGPSKPDTMSSHSMARRESVAIGSYSRLYICKWLNPRVELLSLPMCTRTGDFPYINECRVFRHWINVGSTAVKACCPVGCHFDHILREYVLAKDARCLTRDLQTQYMDSTLYDDSAVDLPLSHTDVVKPDDYVQDVVVHDEILDDGGLYDIDDDGEPLDDSFEVIDPSVLANTDKTWKYYPAPPHLYPGALWNHNPYTGRMEAGKYGYAMPIWMSYAVEPVETLRPPKKRRLKYPPRVKESRRSTEEYDKVSDEDDNEDLQEKKKLDFSGQSFDENDKSSSPPPFAPPLPPPLLPPSPPPQLWKEPTMATPYPVFVTTTSTTEQCIVIPFVPVKPPAPPPSLALLKPMTKPLPPVELIKFTTRPPTSTRNSDEENGFEVDTFPEKNTPTQKPSNEIPKFPMPKKSNEPPPPLAGIPGKSGFEGSSEEENRKAQKPSTKNESSKPNGPVAWKSNEPPPRLAGVPGKSGFEGSSEEKTSTGKKKRSADSGGDPDQSHPVPKSPIIPRQVRNDHQGEKSSQSERQLSVLPDFENSGEQGEISNGGIQNKRNNLPTSNQGNQNVEQKIQIQRIEPEPSPKRKRQVPIAMLRRRVIPDYFCYNY